MTQRLTVDGRVLVPISPEVAAQARQFLPLLPEATGIRWVTVRLLDTPLFIVDTCWCATYDDPQMHPASFAGWECLNPLKEPGP